MKIFRTIVSFLKRFRYGANINPVRDWLAMLTFSAIVLSGIIVGNIWAFDKIARGGTTGPLPAESSIFNRASLDTLRTIFVNRAAEETKYVSGFYTYVDPSQ